MISKESKCTILSLEELAAEWALSEDQVLTLAGAPPDSDLSEWKTRMSTTSLPQNTITRISHLLEIHHSLHALLPSESANTWIHRPNTAKPFNGHSALEFMMSGNLDDMTSVLRYLKAQIYG